MRWLLVSLGLALVGAGAWVRLAPSDPARWNVTVASLPPGDYELPGGFTAVRETTIPEPLSQLDALALDTPRTERLAGDLAEGPVTWVTRSAIWGFPDYTTAWIDEAGNLAVRGRSRFGGYDFGVNRARIGDWLSQMGLT